MYTIMGVVAVVAASIQRCAGTMNLGNRTTLVMVPFRDDFH